MTDEISPISTTARSSEERRPKVSWKIVAVAVAAVLIAPSIGTIWYVFFRHWSVGDLAEQVVMDPDISRPGYKHSLAGKKVVVEGTQYHPGRTQHRRA